MAALLQELEKAATVKRAVVGEQDVEGDPRPIGREVRKDGGQTGQDLVTLALEGRVPPGLFHLQSEKPVCLPARLDLLRAHADTLRHILDQEHRAALCEEKRLRLAKAGVGCSQGID